jgi:uncharacterized low-complexity protein
MKLLIAALLLGSMTAHAEMVSYTSSSASTKNIKLTDSSVDSLVAEGKPACVKDGNRIVKTNRTFGKLGLKYGDCSNGEAAKERASMKGYTVNVIKLEQINASKAKSLGLI